MKCKEAQGRFPEYVDGALSPQETRELEQHLAGCAECAHELALWQEAGSALASTLDCMAVPSTSLDEFVSAVTLAEEEQGTIGRIAAFLATPRRALTATIGGSLAMTMALLFLIWASTSAPAPRQPDRPRIMSPLQQYQLIVGRAEPVEGSELPNGS